VESRLALNIDIAPTFAQLAGVTPGLPEDGRSLVPLLHDRPPRPAWRNGFVVEWLGDETAKEIPPNFEGLRTTRYLYVEYENGWRELYDLQRDPAELRNLAGSAGDAATQAGLMRELHRMLGD
jgi:arylsulfatase A-like enzyme